jgi:hypothetical protein
MPIASIKPKIIDLVLPNRRIQALYFKLMRKKRTQDKGDRSSFEGIRDSVRDALGMRLDKLARQFTATHDVKLKDEIERLNMASSRSRGSSWQR